MYDNDNKEVNTNTETENVYYNYDEPVKEKKKSFFKRIFRGKKKVIKSDDIGVNENFYGNDYKQEPPKDTPAVPIERKIDPPKTKIKPEPTNNSVNQNSSFNKLNNQQNPNYQFVDRQNVKNDDTSMNYNYKPVDEVVEEPAEPLISKKAGYTTIGILVAVAVVIIIINLLVQATEKYQIMVGYSSMTLRIGEGYQIPYLTNDVKNTKFKVSDESVATINSNGYLQPKSVGPNKEYNETTIKIGSDKAKTYKEIKLYVVPTKTSLQLEDFTVPTEVTVKRDEKHLIEITNITPENNTQTLRYSFVSSDTGIATVDGSGFIFGRRKGETTITVKNSSNPELSKEIKVKVK